MNELTQAPLHHHHHSTLEQCPATNEHHSVLSSSSASDKNPICPVIVSLPLPISSTSSNPSMSTHNFYSTAGVSSVKGENLVSQHHHHPHPLHHQHQQVIHNQQESMSSTSMGDEDTDDLGGVAGAGGNDAEGVWSADIEQAFQEALTLYPPCGRRKIILSEEGKMYGRNELIARYIKLRTGKTRTRKQVSSHIQVLARRRAKEVTPNNNGFLSNQQLINKTVATGTGGGGGGGGGGSGSGSVVGPLDGTGLSSFSTPFPPHLKDGSVTPPKLIKCSLKQEGDSEVNISSSSSSIPKDGGFLSHYPATVNSTILSSWQSSGANVGGSGVVGSLSTSQTSLTNNSKYSTWVSSNDVNYHHLSASTSAHHHSLHLHHHHPPVATTPADAPISSSSSSSTAAAAATTNVSSSGNLIHAMSCAKLQLLHLAAYISHDSYALSDQICFYLPPEQYESNETHPLWHLFVRVHIDNNSSYHSSSSDSIKSNRLNNNKSTIVSSHMNYLEPLDITQISDKFPDRNGLKDLFEKGPQDAFFLIKIWGDVNTNISEGAYFGTSLAMQSVENLPVRLNTKICSFGKQVVEKIEDGLPVLENSRYIYRFNKSEMCDYMKSFISKLLQLESTRMMNSVLENFTILQVATHLHTKETLLCLAYVFEVSHSSYGSQHKLYRLASGPTSNSSSSVQP